MIEVPVKAVNVAAMDERVAGGEAAKGEMGEAVAKSVTDMADTMTANNAKQAASKTEGNENAKQAATTTVTVNIAKKNDPPDDPIVQVETNLAVTKPQRR